MNVDEAPSRQRRASEGDNKRHSGDVKISNDLNDLLKRYVKEQDQTEANIIAKWREFVKGKGMPDRQTYSHWRSWATYRNGYVLKSPVDKEYNLVEKQYATELKSDKLKTPVDREVAPDYISNNAAALRRIDNAIWRAWQGHLGRMRRSSNSAMDEDESGSNQDLKARGHRGGSGISPQLLRRLVQQADMDIVPPSPFSTAPAPERPSMVRQTSESSQASATQQQTTDRRDSANSTDSAMDEDGKGTESMTTKTEKTTDKTDTSLSKNEARRQAHIVAEQKRRNNIRSGFDDLQALIPACNTRIPNQKQSKTAIIGKTIAHIESLEKSRSQLQAEVNEMMEELMTLRAIEAKQMQLTSLAQQRQLKMIKESNTSTSTVEQDNLTLFNAFRSAADLLFAGFQKNVDLTDFDTLTGTIRNWMEMEFNSQILRRGAMAALGVLADSDRIFYYDATGRIRMTNNQNM
eukprot:Clim_evm11s166 gene=Clim_evmTU11s166